MDDTVLLAKVMAFEIGLNGDSRVRDPCKMQQNLRNFTSKNPPPFSFHTLSVRRTNKRGYTGLSESEAGRKTVGREGREFSRNGKLRFRLTEGIKKILSKCF